MFAAIPRHFMGELARTVKGCSILKTRNIVRELITTTFDRSQPSLQRRAALWALVSLVCWLMHKNSCLP